MPAAAPAVLALALIAAACGDGAPVEPPPAATRLINVLPDTLRFTYLGERMRAQVRTQPNPKLYEGREVKWSSTDTTIITVDEEGEVTALANGEAGLAAELIGFRDTAYVRVRQLATEIEVLGGGQRGIPGLRLPEPVGVRLTDAGGTLMAVWTVAFFDASAHGGRVSTARVTSSERTGEAWTEWTLGLEPGPQRLAVEVGVTSRQIVASADIGAVGLVPDSVLAGLAVHSGDRQGALEGQALAEPVVVVVLDTLGRGVPGVVVRFEPAAGHGSVDPAEVRSDTSGLAATVWTMGEVPGRQTMVASAALGLSVEITGTSQSEEGVCARTPVVAEEIVRQTGAASCADVTEAHLAGMRDLQLDHRGIRSLGSGDFAGLTGLIDLELRYNELSALPPGIFDGLGALEDLHLGFNRLEALPPDIFADATELTSLFLHNNRLEGLPPGVFAGLGELRWLWLNDNELTELPPDIFADATELTYLFLNNNLLEGLRPGVFDGLARARRLYLNDNQLGTLPPGVFADMVELQRLRLNYNELSALPPGIFDGLGKLETLDLHGNRLTELPPDVFDDLESLVSLKLSFNGFTELPPGVFDGLGKLETLNLRLNRLAELRPGVFTGLANLRQLYLQSNELAELPTGIFEGLRSLDEVQAWNNPGTPFAFGVEFARLDADWLAPGPARVAMRVPRGAPFGFRMQISVQRGTASAAWLEVAAGDTVSAPLVVERPSGGTGAAHLSFGQLPGLPVHYVGLEVVGGEPAVLFAESDNRTPAVAEPLPAYWLQAGSEAEPLPLGPHFRDPDGDSLVYEVGTSDGRVAGGRVRDGVLWMEPRAAGEAVLEVTASDPGGLAASQLVALEVVAAADPNRFDIHLVFGPGWPERHKEVARQAADRWEEVVVGDLPDVPVDGYLRGCGINNLGTRIAGVIDDLVIRMGRNSEPSLSYAGHCGKRQVSGLTFWGGNQYASWYFRPGFDQWDRFHNTVLHEIGHVLGIGFLNQSKTQPNTSPPDHYFPGPLAVKAFNAAGGDAYIGSRVPLENDSRLYPRVHWRLAVFGKEVMVGFPANVISAITVQALADLGHVVDLSKADPFTLAWAGSGPAPAGADDADAEAFEFVDEVVQNPVIVVDSTGKVVRVIRN